MLLIQILNPVIYQPTAYKQIIVSGNEKVLQVLSVPRGRGSVLATKPDK